MCQLSDASHCIASLFKVPNQVPCISGGYVQKTSQKQPEMVLFAAKRTFQISKLQNYTSHVNETWSRYVPPQHISFAHKGSSG